MNRNEISILRWQPLASLLIFCELHSTEAEVLQRTQRLFASSAPEIIAQNAEQTSAAQPDAPRPTSLCRWSVERDENATNADCWRARNLDSGQTFSGDIARLLTNIEYSTVQTLVDVVKTGATPFFAIHAALLCKDDFGLIVVGPSESGKSTLACGLWCNGWQLLADDFCFLRADSTNVASAKADSQNGSSSNSHSLKTYCASPAARRVSLRNGSRTLVGDLWPRLQNAPSSFQTDEGWLFHPHEVEHEEVEDNNVEDSPSPRSQTVRVCAILMLGRGEETFGGSAQFSLQPIASARAAIALLPYCTLLPRGDDLSDVAANRVLDWGAALPKIAPLVESTPVYAMKRGALPRMIESVETLRCEIASANASAQQGAREKP